MTWVVKWKEKNISDFALMKKDYFHFFFYFQFIYCIEKKKEVEETFQNKKDNIC